MLSIEEIWCSPALDIALTKSDVHVWRAYLDQPLLLVERLAEILSEEELARARRFHFESDRRRFIISRSVLRIILGRYLDTGPDQLQFSYLSNGKPYLANNRAGMTFRFNLSHSHGLALLAFTCDREVGIDLEYIRPVPDIDQMAARYFSFQEYATLQSLSDFQRLEAFFACWTRKESYLKAIGFGLNHPMNMFEVSLAPGEPARLLNVRNHPGAAERWRLETLYPAHGYAAALAVEGYDWCLSCWEYSANPKSIVL
jgi:4'-phosphopantetheinyl transferase